MTKSRFGVTIIAYRSANINALFERTDIMKKITDSVIYIGVDDKELDLFEGQYIIPNGVSYNSYLILDEKVAVMDTVDKRKTGEWLEKLDNALDGRTPDYAVISHLEPDHASSLDKLVSKYPDITLVMSAKAKSMLPQFFDGGISADIITVSEGGELNLGAHTLAFYMAPMVHWPEVMVTYDKKDKILFTADGFGKFGALDTDEDWACEARRYYFNIVGKYGAQVQALLKKASAIDIKIICPLHGPILTENLGYYIEKYDIWSSYGSEDDGVFIAYASMHGNTAEAAKKLKEILEQEGAKKVAITDLARDDMAEAVEDAFRYDKLVLAAPTYDAGLPPFMHDFIYHLKHKNYQNKRIAFIENGSWAPVSGKLMAAECAEMKNVTLCENKVTLKSTLKSVNTDEMKALAKELLGV